MTHLSTTIRRWLAVAALLGACHGHDVGGTDEVIGDPCTADRDCLHHCYLDGGDNFPGGFCSQSCASDLDCPSDTDCVTAAGGVCMFSCPPFDCSFLGPGWRCDGRDRVEGGKANVCIGG